MLLTIIGIVMSAFSIFILIGRVLTEYEPNDLNRIKTILSDVYLDIAITFSIFIFFPSISSMVFHLFTVKFILLSFINYEALLRTKVSEP